MSRTKPKVKASAPPRAAALFAWYDEHRRILPWRALPGSVQDPYRVWLSEVMLQQTTVAAVAPYYQKFLKRWPTIHHLAKATNAQVMQMWAGLGYYRRAHLLHDCAKMICADFDGQFPTTENELLQLPGFGPYTAAAVAAIAFDQRANVVDGNVERVIARIFAIREPMPKAKAALREAAATLLPNARHGDYAQALMDLGATICTPRNPKCGLCPWSRSCKAHELGIEESLPAREKVKARPVRRAIAFVLIDKDNRVFLRRRPKGGLLGGMMEVPSNEWSEGKMSSLAAAQKFAPIKAKWRVLPGSVRHVFSHFELEVSVAVAAAPRKIPGTWAPLTKLKDYALPSVMLKIVRYAANTI
ncbi:MAG TPA: A/G-specific adenine glycosylase [Alphaproteobacteria bacterium]|nr:A/G-specific adenine glycosylase [Alphaproteobacteria bacterium]